MNKMSIPPEIQSKIDQVPTYDSREVWPYKILNKSSASTSIIIRTKVPKPNSGGCPAKKTGGNIPIVLKTWCKYGRRPVLEEEALEYEKKVYVNYIHNILTKDPDAPFLRYLGDDNDCSTVQSLAHFIGVDSVGAMITLCLAFFVMDEMARDGSIYYKMMGHHGTIDYESKTFYTTYFTINGHRGPDFERRFREITNWKIGAILLPLKYFSTFENIVGTDIQIPTFRQVVKGLYTIHQYRLVHNDLHPGNIMVEETTEKVLIYDWDRAYAPRIGNNPNLNANPCEDLCSSSQCNIMLDERPIDLLKLLGYIVGDVGNFNHFLSQGLKIKNFRVRGRQIFDIIHGGIANCDGDKFFKNKGCSALYSENHCMALEEAIQYLGTWSVINARAFPGTNHAKVTVKSAPMAKIYKHILAFIVAVLIPVMLKQFGFAKFGMLAVLPGRSVESDMYNVRKKYRKIFWKLKIRGI